MKLVRASGIKLCPTIGEDAKKILLDTAFAFLRAGGTVSIDDWGEMSDEERAALASAGRSIAIEQAVITGLSAQGVEKAAKVFSGIDGGAAFAQMFTDAMAALQKDALKGQEFQER